MKSSSKAALAAAAALVCALLLIPPAGASAFGPIAGFGAYGSGAGQTVGLGGAAVAPDGTFYVSDRDGNRVEAVTYVK